MKFIAEYRNPDLVTQYLDQLKKTATRPWAIMEVCGGQTHSLVKNGILNLLPEKVQMIHGPGCPGLCHSLKPHRQGGFPG
jgi:hydrogenase expression/formation protein HypD